MKDILKSLWKGAGFLTAVFIIIFLWSQHTQIKILKEELSLCNEIEFIHTRDTIRDTVPNYSKITLPSVQDTEYIEIIEYLENELTLEDSLSIARKIIAQIEDYNSVKKYDHVFKDDSSAYIQFKANVYKNSLENPELIFENRYPSVKYKSVQPKNEVYGGFGMTTLGPIFNIGLMGKTGIYYQAQADPIHDYYGASINFRLFKFK